MTSKETRIIESVKADNKATIDKIGEMLVAFKASGQDVGSPIHIELIGRLDKMEEHQVDITRLMEGHIVKHESDTQEMMGKLEPVLNALQTAGSLKKILFGFTAIVLALAGSIAGVKSIIGYFK